jgi:hypothetical protein
MSRVLWFLGTGIGGHGALYEAQNWQARRNKENKTHININDTGMLLAHISLGASTNLLHAMILPGLMITGVCCVGIGKTNETIWAMWREKWYRPENE